MWTRYQVTGKRVRVVSLPTDPYTLIEFGDEGFIDRVDPETNLADIILDSGKRVWLAAEYYELIGDDDGADDPGGLGAIPPRTPPPS